MDLSESGENSNMKLVNDVPNNLMILIPKLNSREINLIFRSPKPLVFDFSQTFSGILHNPLREWNGCYDNDKHIVELEDVNTSKNTVYDICKKNNSLIRTGSVVRLKIKKRPTEYVNWRNFDIPQNFTCNKTCISSHFVYITTSIK